MNKNKPIIASRIKNLRKDKGLTQEQLAEILGLNAKSSIANYESGANSPSDDIKKKICEEFNCSMDYLMGMTSYKNPKEDLEKELYQLNLTEEEFDELIYTLLDEDSGDIDNILRSDTKLAIACEKCLDLIFDYGKDDTNNLHEYIPKLTNFIKTLDKSKIIYNYQNNINNKQYYMCPVYGQISAGQPNWAEECIEGRIPIDPSLMDIVDPKECFFLRVNGESMNKVVKNGSYALIRKTDWVENGEIAVVLVNGFDATLKKFSKQGDLIVLEPMSNDNSFQVQIYDKNTSIKILGKYIGKFEMNNG